MKPYRLPAFALAILYALLLAPAMANSGSNDPHGSAAALYERGDYAGAYKQYLKLAKSGDTFSQYRLSYMSLMGLGTEANVVDSMAWAVLAAESEHASLTRYEAAVAAMVPGELRKKAQSRADYYVRRWGREDSSGGQTRARSSQAGCTGSRLAANCEMSDPGGAGWITWGADKSSDPAHREHIEELNQTIVDNAAQLGARSTS
jgi:TPR repeat protein